MRAETLAAAGLGAAVSSPRTAPGIFGGESAPFLALPDGYKVRSLESLLPEPTRHHGSVTLHTAESFITLVKDLTDEHLSQARLYCQVEPPQFTAVLNDDQPDCPGWRDWRAVYTCPLSPEWKRWVQASGVKKTQTDFAMFIEDNAPDIIEPASADMIEISRTLEAKKSVNFASGIRLTTGQNQLTYEETISGTASRGQLQIPELFKLAIPVLQGGPRYQVEARLRYRIAPGGLTMWYDLVRPHMIIDHVVAELRTQIAEGTGMTVFVGVPA